ncbi:unnamed protein product [Rotaria magnacalcarata]|uniref:Uncharacterized protein n=1 Tax=Rotaria magnacalcarata TaxID=392030 RepID=A0A820AJI8_9BILA|nr:unnamed protein product [Rotaria magnacalcarata]CAF1935563.1 unnamed protein product [Rotaria magnacalcarata]CAF4178650.1 unnamed protein product [Rotaria magnacalcarata]CAF5008621.1 unnamed protein product [Rotaria magnacalcarata]
MLRDLKNEDNQPVTKVWIVPSLNHVDIIQTNKITSLSVTGFLKSLSNDYYFNNLKYLVIYCLDNDLLRWLMTYVDFSSIQYLDISSIGNEYKAIHISGPKKPTFSGPGLPMTDYQPLQSAC